MVLLYLLVILVLLYLLVLLVLLVLQILLVFTGFTVFTCFTVFTGFTCFTDFTVFTGFTVFACFNIKADATVTNDPKNVAIRFGPEFKFLNQPISTYTSADLSGYSANSMKLLVQVVTGDTKPLPTAWKEIDVTSEISGSSINGYITMSGITGTTFQIDKATYTGAPIYNLANYIDLPQNGQTNYLNFGDEYYFYGNLQTDISATIYEMKYLVNLGRNQFTNTSNPTWMSGTTSYVTEIGLYNAQKDLMVISKLQSPELRQGIQQFVVKLDF